MIADIPAAKDFYTSGKELLDFAWDMVADLLANMEEAGDFGIDQDEISDAYWASAKRHLTTALSITQQGVELILRGRIADVSPFLLLAGHPSSWPSPYKGMTIKFSEFRTIDAQDLIKVHDIFCADRFPSDFIDRYNSLRERRNVLMHSIDKNLGVQVIDVIDSVLFMHKRLFPDETWGRCVINSC